MYLIPGTIDLKLPLYKFLITLLLGGNTGLLGLLIRFVWKNYRRYKNAFMVFLEEHEKLVEDYIQRHPEEKPNSNYFSGRKKSRIEISSRENRSERSNSDKWDE